MKCDAKTFAKMYENVCRDMYRFALCMMGNSHDAEDAVSEAVMHAYGHISSLKKEEAFKSWIFTILANVCKKKLKNRLKRHDVEVEESSGWEVSSWSETDYGLAVDVRKAFSVLSEEEQAIVGLSVFGGYTSSEIGRMMHLNANTVRSRRSRALEKMSVILEG